MYEHMTLTEQFAEQTQPAVKRSAQLDERVCMQGVRLLVLCHKVAPDSRVNGCT